MAERTVIELEMRLRKAEQAVRGMKKTETAATRMGESFKSAAAQFLAIGALGTGVARAFSVATEAALSQDRIFRRLQTSIELTGKSYQNIEKSLKGYFAELQATTEFGDTDSAQVMTTLLQLTGDYNKSLKALPLALDVAATGLFDINTAARNVAMVMEGNIELMARYIPELKSSVTPFLKTASAAEKTEFAVRVLNERFGGTAQENVKSYAGGLERIKNTFGDVQEAAGELILELGKSEEGEGWVIRQLQTLERLLKEGNLIGILARVAPQIGGLAGVLGFEALTEGDTEQKVKSLSDKLKEARQGLQQHKPIVEETKTAYQEFREELIQQEEKQKQILQFQRQYGEELLKTANVQREIKNVAVEPIEAQARALQEVSLLKTDAYDIAPVIQYGQAVQNIASTMSDQWSQALLNQWNEGQNFFQNMARGFEQMVASMAASVMARAGVFLLLSLIAGGTGGAANLLGNKFGAFALSGIGINPGASGSSTGSSIERAPASNINIQLQESNRAFVRNVLIPEITRAQRLGHVR